MGAAPAHMVNSGLFEGYDTGSFYDEMFSASGEPRTQYAKLFQKLAAMAPGKARRFFHLVVRA